MSPARPETSGAVAGTATQTVGSATSGGGTGASGAGGVDAVGTTGEVTASSTDGTSQGSGGGSTDGAAGIGGSGGQPGAGGSTAQGGTTGSGGTGTLNCEPAATLREAAECTGRLIGAALAASHLGENDYASAAREHNYVTAENEMKWGSIEPSRGNFNFGSADQIVNFALDNDMKIKGHTLVWGEQLPSWVEGISSATDLRAAMVDHIKGVMSHYKGKVSDWDVVNEVFITDGRTGDGNARLRDTVFSRVIGPSYIDDAFIAAREADPDALLIFNEFANEGLSDKSDAVYAMVKDMVERGIPIDAVGMQMHVGVNTNPTVEEVTTNMQRLADLGLKVFVSEMDVNGCHGYTPEETAAYYHDMVGVCVAQPACIGFTIWGVTDKYSWLNTSLEDSQCSGGQSPFPLLWDDNYGKKSSYTAVMNALLGE